MAVISYTTYIQRILKQHSLQTVHFFHGKFIEVHNTRVSLLTFLISNPHPKGFWYPCEDLTVTTQFLAVQINYRFLITFTRSYHLEFDTTVAEEYISKALKPVILFSNFVLVPPKNILFNCSHFFFFLLNTYSHTDQV